MRPATSIRAAGTGLALALAASACGDVQPTEPVASLQAPLALQVTPPPAPSIRINEIRIDQPGTDNDEYVEIQGPPGTDLSGVFYVVLGDGSGGSVGVVEALLELTGQSIPLSGRLLVAESTFTLGSPDLITNLNFENGDEVTHLLVRDFLGGAGDELDTDGDGIIDGAFGGPPWGELLDCVSLLGGNPRPAYCSVTNGPDGSFVPAHSYRGANGAWNVGAFEVGPLDTPGGENAPGEAGGPGGGSGGGAPGGGSALISEVRIDQPSTDDDEYFELFGEAGTSLNGLTYLVIGDGTGGSGVIEAVVDLTGQSIPADGYFVAAESTFSLGFADLETSLNFENGDNVTHLLVRDFAGSDGQDLDADDDGVLDSTPWSEIVDGVSLIETPVGGERAYCSGAAAVGPDGTNVPGHIYRDAEGWSIGAFGGGDTSPRETNPSGPFDARVGACGGDAGSGGGEPPAGEPGVVAQVSLGAPGGAILPQGFRKPVFPSAVDAFGTPIEGVDFGFTSSDPGVATVDEFGNVTALSVGTAEIRGEAPNGVVGVLTFQVLPATAPTSAVYLDHDEFGRPADGDPSDDIVLVKDQYIVSYNPARGGPNWVSWNLNGSHFGSSSRCECWTPDPALPAGTVEVVNFDFTGSGYNRGHMAQSFNRTSTLQENAVTFYTTNALPQADENNQGPWLDFENDVNDRVRAEGLEAYVVAGAEWALNPSTLKDEGRVAIPDYTWKVVVLLPGGGDLGDVTGPSDLEVLAIRVPNLEVPGVPASALGIQGLPWEEFQVTVDEIEAATGYDLLDLLPDGIEAAVESDSQPPVASVAGPDRLIAGQVGSFSAVASTDPDGDPLTFGWDFGDGGRATGSSVEYAFQKAGSYAVTVTVEDPAGLSADASLLVEVITARKAVDALVRDFQGYIKTGAVERRGRAPLIFLRSAQRALKRDRDWVAQLMLRSFVRVVDFNARKGRIDPEAARSMVADAKAILSAL